MNVSGGIAGDLPSRSPSKNSAETDDEADPPAPAPATVGGRKKAAAGVRAWLAVNSAGEARMVEAGKHAIMKRTGLPAWDLRILDPQLSYPSTVLGRERAIVINLEHIKAVITVHEVLVLNSRDPTVSPFVHQLQRRLNLWHGHQIEGGGGESGDGSDAYALEEIRASRSHFENYENLDYSEEDEGKAEMEEGKWKEGGDLANSNGPKALPFEFIALEACLEAACSCLELEVRDELEHLLDDDEDMVEMYLTNKFLQQQESNGSPQSCQLDQDSSFNGERIPAEISSDENDMESHNYTVISGSSLSLRDGHESHTFSIRTSSKYLDVEDLEMLLEAYFVQIDSTLNNLSTVGCLSKKVLAPPAGGEDVQRRLQWTTSLRRLKSTPV